jgi:ferredoxin
MERQLHTIKILPKQIEFSASSDQTILDAAIEQGIELPHRCQIGACSSCLCKKVSGQVSYKLEPMLTSSEMEQGWTFICLAQAESDVVIDFSA